MKATLLCNSITISPTPTPTTFSSRLSQFPNFSPLIIKHNRFSSRSLLTETVEGGTTEEPTANSVSRRLILLRHAESSWEDRTVRDHERPLSKAGRVDAISVSRKLQQLGWIPELILSSDAARTRETLRIMQEQVRGFLEAEVHFFSSFYSIAAMDGQTAEHIQQAVCEYSRDEILTVMCMGHNRGWEEAASMFSGALVELKACNAALLEATGKSWNEAILQVLSLNLEESSDYEDPHTVGHRDSWSMAYSNGRYLANLRAFSLAGVGGWKLQGIVKPNGNL